jgi:osmoprotectant transport system ATP-binding protein
MIRFEQVTKRFADGTTAVDALDLEIADGETVMLVGPSGCGKTTSLRLINRLEEATGGRVLVNGQAVSQVDPTQLRRGIGYVIQHAGLFPHRRIDGNVATVPRLLGWARDTIAPKVDDMLETVGLDRAVTQRFPHQLSGGQQQRVGVARALAGEPPVLLMDEPFAAVDPIVRARLQQEFLDLKKRVRKTIVFVTHDVDEAIKLGDKIAILKEGGRLAQYGRPVDILARPADDFVADFVGRERTLKRLALITADSLEVTAGNPVDPDADAERVGAAASEAGQPWVPVVGPNRRFQGWCDSRRLVNGHTAGQVAGAPEIATVGPGDTLRTALDAALSAESRSVVRVDQAGQYLGVITLDRIAEAGLWS